MACQECGADTDCPSGSGCTNGLCVETCQHNDIHCGSFNGITCGTCRDDGQCLTPNGCESLFVPYPSSGDGAVNLVSGAGELTVESRNGIYHVDTKTGVWTLLDGSPQAPAMLTSNSTDALWISLDSQGATSVKMAPLAGGAITTVVPSSTSLAGIERDAADVGHFYGVTGSGIFAWPLASSAAPRLLTSDLPIALSASGGRVYYSTPEVVKMVDLSGTVTQLATTSPREPSLVTDDRYVYWSDADGIHRMAQALGNASLWVPLDGLPGSPAGTPFLLQADGSALYILADSTVDRIDSVTGVGRALFAYENDFSIVGMTAWSLGSDGLDRITILPQ